MSDCRMDTPESRMQNLSSDIIMRVEEYVSDLCSDRAFFWIDHIRSTVQHARELAQQQNGDEELVVVAAWLHDLSNVKDGVVSSADEARDLLRDWGYETERIERVRGCILKHAFTGSCVPESLEEKIVASADALSHLDLFPVLAYLSYKNNEPDEAHQWLMDIIEKRFNFLMPEAKEIARPKYEAIKLLLGE